MLSNQLIEFEKILEENFRWRHDPAFYVKAMKTSLYYLNKLTQANYKKSLNDTIQERIHKEVLQLLTHSQLSINQIAYHIGCSDPSFFHRCFKQRMQMTPRQYRLRSMRSE